MPARVIRYRLQNISTARSGFTQLRNPNPERKNVTKLLMDQMGNMMETDIDRVWKHVAFLASEPRFAETQRLEECRQYCEDELVSSGWNIDRRNFRAIGSEGNSVAGINLVGNRDDTTDESRPKFVLGAHVDSCRDTPGADDNASAVAVLLEVSRILNQRIPADGWASLPVQLELVVFDLEEHGMLGGEYHAATCKEEQQVLCGMISLEMLGYCCHEPGSQTLPQQLVGLYPDVGNFIAVVGNQNSTELIRHFETAFGSVDGLPAESLQVPHDGRELAPSRLSDHSPFWDEGFSALMITDTSFMRNPHYHQTTDTPDTLDREFLHKVADGVLRGVETLIRNGL